MLINYKKAKSGMLKKQSTIFLKEISFTDTKLIYLYF